MAKYHWLGGTTNLGRFGTVRRGDIVNLTDKEDESIQGQGPNGAIDPRFQPFKEGAKIEGAGLDLPEGYERLSQAEQGGARHVAEDTRKRAEALAQRTDPRAGVVGAGAAGQPVKSTVADEQARLQRLNRANDDTDTENYREMTKAELWELIDQMRREGKDIDVQKEATRPTLLRAVLISKGLDASDIEEPTK